MFWLIILGIAVYVSYQYIYNSEDEKFERPPTILPTIASLNVPETGVSSPRDQIATRVESLDWCNDITRICWPYIGKIMNAELAPTIEPLINMYLPKPFSNFKILSTDLGKDPLKVDRVTVHRRYKNSITLDLDVTFKGAPKMSMKCSPLHAPFGIKELTWTARLAVMLRPLIPTIPLVGAVQVAMIDHPKIDMNFTGVAEIADFGPVEKVVRKVLKNVIAAIAVLPNRITYKMVESVSYFDIYMPPRGALVVTIDKGRGFTKEKKMGLIKQTPDLYCKATFGLEEMKTDARINKLEPQWGVTKSFIISDMDQPFELKCYDQDRVTRDDLVGRIKLSAYDLILKESEWIRFQSDIDEDIAENGEILLKAQFKRLELPPIHGACVVSILVEGAIGLPENTKNASCNIRVGRQPVRQTPVISKPAKPVPGIDPVNPSWCVSFDVLCDRLSDADVRIDVLSGKSSVGKVIVSAAELNAPSTTNEDGQIVRHNEKSGPFPLDNGGVLKAKVILNGLTQQRLQA